MSWEKLRSDLAAGGRAYFQLTELLDRHAKHVVSIEILKPGYPLPPEHEFLEVDRQIGIPKKTLVLAVVYAARAFFANNGRLMEPDCRSRVMDASRILLLWHPEHTTACNARKKILLLSRDSGDGFDSLLSKEQLFVTSLVTSHLKRHTKSPTLWQHRMWMLTQFTDYAKVKPLDEKAGFAETLELVFAAGELHPHNYYAWQHARLLLQSLKNSEEVIRESIGPVEIWCRKHPSDISGWMFLWSLLQDCSSDTAGSRDMFGLHQQLLTKTTENALNWKQDSEAIWTFSRLMVGTKGILNTSILVEQLNVLDRLRSEHLIDDTSRSGKKDLGFKTISWLKEYAGESVVREEAGRILERSEKGE